MNLKGHRDIKNLCSKIPFLFVSGIIFKVMTLQFAFFYLDKLKTGTINNHKPFLSQLNIITNNPPSAVYIRNIFNNKINRNN